MGDASRFDNMAEQVEVGEIEAHAKDWLLILRRPRT
jgi:hypothetical protein